jgi:hypothetical protein
MFAASCYVAPLRRTALRNTGCGTVCHSSTFFVVEWIQQSFLHVHQQYDIPWWVVFPVGTVSMRLMLLPLVRKQMMEAKSLRRVIPEVNMLTQLYKKKISAFPDGESGVDKASRIKTVTGAYLRGVKSTLVLHDVSLIRLLSPIVVNFSLFVTFVYSIRTLILKNSARYGGGAPLAADSNASAPVVWDSSKLVLENPLSMPTPVPLPTGLDTGGLFWFTDLTQCDPTYVLPVCSIGLSYLGINIAFSNTDKIQAASSTNTVALSKLPGPMLFLQEFALTALLLAVPFVSQLPAGVFLYWTTNSCFSISQSLLLRNPRFRKLIKVD